MCSTSLALAKRKGRVDQETPYGVAFAEAPNTGVQTADTNQLSYDIYLKGNASRATSFFGSSPALKDLSVWVYATVSSQLSNDDGW